MTTTDDMTPADTAEQPDPAEGQQPDDGGREPDEEGQEPDEEGQQQPEGDRGAREAAKYRQRARAAEAERDRLRERLERYQRAEVEAMAAEVLAVGGDLLAVRPDMAGYLGEDGHVDPARVREAAEAVAAERPHWRLDDGEEPGRAQVRGRPKPFRNMPKASGWDAVISPRRG
ncbi:hypothetical protein [Quadrisphaera setariae]|uniref:Uncharacterized protein n=1 Tax=Quadrisphaera setariae TaxID=2593304 RepID=A0A5C8ZF44_9ACTN|nr:hypothetical protein [Quadrisphaera setariae]TXR56472.1 hypothetical protein FMM08_10315 [Quadrisphaera setariae]